MSDRFARWLTEHNRGYLLLLVFAVLALYLPFLGNPFFFDDLSFFSNKVEFYPWQEALVTARALPYDILVWMGSLFGQDLPHAYRLVNDLLHLANVLALFVLLRALLREHIAQQEYASSDFAAAVGALVFALHPLATYAAGYVVQGSILLANLLCLLALWSWLRALQSGQAGWAGLALLCFYLACISKEHAITLPLVLAALTLLQRRQLRLARVWIGLFCLGLAAIAAFILWRKLNLVGMAYEPMSEHVFQQSGLQPDPRHAHALSIATQAGLFFRYLLLWALPLPGWMAVDLRAGFMPTLTDWRAFGGLLAYGAYGLLAFGLLLRRGTAGLLGLGLLAPWLMFPVEFASVRVQETFVLYRSYLWLPLLSLLPALLILRLHFTGRASRTAAVTVLAALLAMVSANRLWVAADTWRLWDDAARLLDNERQPGADRILYNRANAALAAGKPAAAVADLTKVAALSPELWQVWQALGIAQVSNNQAAPGAQSLARALQLKPGDGQLQYAYAIALRRSGQNAQAMTALEGACKAGYATACLLVARTQVEGRAAGASDAPRAASAL